MESFRQGGQNPYSHSWPAVLPTVAVLHLMVPLTSGDISVPNDLNKYKGNHGKRPANRGLLPWLLSRLQDNLEGRTIGIVVCTPFSNRRLACQTWRNAMFFPAIGVSLPFHDRNAIPERGCASVERAIIPPELYEDGIAIGFSVKDCSPISGDWPGGALTAPPIGIAFPVATAATPPGLRKPASRCLYRAIYRPLSQPGCGFLWAPATGLPSTLSFRPFFTVSPLGLMLSSVTDCQLANGGSNFRIGGSQFIQAHGYALPVRGAFQRFDHGVIDGRLARSTRTQALQLNWTTSVLAV